MLEDHREVMVRALVRASSNGQGPQSFALGGRVAEIDLWLGNHLEGLVALKEIEEDGSRG